MNKEDVQTVSFQIIGYAGDAFSCFYKSVEAARKGNFELADSLVGQGKSSLTKAHNAQTDLLAAEARGENVEHSVILVHAQDHLMTAIMYEHIAREFIELYKERRS